MYVWKCLYQIDVLCIFPDLYMNAHECLHTFTCDTLYLAFRAMHILPCVYSSQYSHVSIQKVNPDNTGDPLPNLQCKDDENKRIVYAILHAKDLIAHTY